MSKATFIIGAAVGYVLGARAGRRRYDQIKAGADRLWHDQRVQQGVGQVSDYVKDRAPEVQHKVVDGAKKVADTVASKTPLGKRSRSGS